MGKRVFMIGATGTIGKATVRALVDAGHEVVCFVRAKKDVADESAGLESKSPGATVRVGHVTDPDSLERDGFCGERFDVMVSTLASRTGAPKDAWAIDYQAQVNAIDAAKQAGVAQVVLLSAICVQKPLLDFQQAKLASEKALKESGLIYSIVRPTAFFKSLSGQIERVKRGKAFLVFGDGEITACKPISDEDLGAYLAECIEDQTRHNRVLPIGGPGEAITPREQGEHLFALLNQPPRFKHVPVRMLDAIIRVLSLVGRFIPAIEDKAQLARIGRYYATESMLVLNPATDQYDAAATPSTGKDTLFEYYEQVLKGESKPERGDHAVF